MNLFQILELCTDEMSVVVGAVKTIFTLIQVAIPGVLIILGTVDMFKAMTNGDEKEQQKARKVFIKRLIYAVVAFLVPFIIRLVFNFVASNINTDEGKTGQSAYEDFFACWNGSKDTSGNSSSTNNSGSNSCWYQDNGGSWHQGSATSKQDCDNAGYSVHCWGNKKACTGSN